MDRQTLDQLNNTLINPNGPEGKISAENHREFNNALADYTDSVRASIADGSNLGLLKTTDTPPPVGNFRGDVNTAGTYTNFKTVGGAAISFTQAEIDNNYAFIYVSNNVAIKDLKLKPVVTGKIEAWTAKIYSGGFQVIKDGVTYESTAATAATDIPGASSKWKALTYIPGVNVLSNGGSLLADGYNNANVTIAPSGLLRVSGSANIRIVNLPVSGKVRYFAVTKAENITGSPLLGPRQGYFSTVPIIVGQSYRIEANEYDLYVNANGGSVDLGAVYIGDVPYNAAFIENKAPRVIDNYISRDIFKGQAGATGLNSIKVFGNDSEQTVSIDIPRSAAGEYASVLYQSNLTGLKVVTSNLSDTGTLQNTVSTTYTAISPISKHLLSKVFEGNALYTSVRLSVVFTGSATDWVELTAPAITKEVREISDLLVNNAPLNITDIINNRPKNIIPGGGIISALGIAKSANTEAATGYVRITGASAVIVYNLPVTTVETNFTLLDAINLVGSPQIGFRIGAGIHYIKAVVGKPYKIPAGVSQIVVNAGASGSIDISKIYLGVNAYNLDWLDTAVPALNNYFPNQNLNGYPSKITDTYGVSKLRLVGNNAVQKIAVIFDKINESDYASVLYKSSVNGSVTVAFGEYTPGGGAANGTTGSVINISGVEVVASRKFGTNPKTYIEISFTGTSGDYLEVYAPAITKVLRQVDTPLIDKSTATIAGGLSTFDTLYSALLSDPSGIFQVGRNLFTRKKTGPTLKTDYSLVNSNFEPQKSAKLQALKYVNLGTWRLLLVTTKKRFIFCDGTNLKYTDNLSECLIAGADVGIEKRFTLDSSKLTQMIAVFAVGVRELGNGELIVWTYGTSHYYTTNNQTVFNLSSSHPATGGSKIDGWGLDAYGDTVVFSTYAPAPARAQGSVILSTDGGKTYSEVFNLGNPTSKAFFPDIDIASIHLHGVFIDGWRETIFLVVGDFDFTTASPGKILVLKNYKSNLIWEVLPANFKEGIREQYCTGIAMEKQILFGTDMNETCIARLNLSDAGYNSPREVADALTIGLNYIPNFTRPVEPNAPIGIHYSYVLGATPSAIKLTKDGVNFATIYTDTVAHSGFGNNNARVWCTVNGDVYCMQFGGRFTNELIIGKYNGFNMI